MLFSVDENHQLAVLQPDIKFAPSKLCDTGEHKPVICLFLEIIKTLPPSLKTAKFALRGAPQKASNLQK